MIYFYSEFKFIFGWKNKCILNFSWYDSINWIFSKLHFSKLIEKTYWLSWIWLSPSFFLVRVVCLIWLLEKLAFPYKKKIGILWVWPLLLIPCRVFRKIFDIPLLFWGLSDHTATPWRMFIKIGWSFELCK